MSTKFAERSTSQLETAREGVCLCGCGQETQPWMSNGEVDGYRLYVVGHGDAHTDPEAKQQDDEAMRSDPLCLRVGDPIGIELINRSIEYFGTAMNLEDTLGMSHGALNRYRNERYLHLDLVDKLLVMMSDQHLLDDFEFRRRSEWSTILGRSGVATS